MQKLVCKGWRIQGGRVYVLQVLNLLRASSGTLAPEGTNILRSNIIRLPKLDPGQITKPYIASPGDIAQVDAVRLLDDQVRQLSNMPRSVEESVFLKVRAKEVRSTLLHPSRPPMRKISQSKLEAE